MAPLQRFPVRHRGARVTSSSPFFSSFHVPLSLPLSNFLNSPSFHISSFESLLTNPPPLLHTSKPAAGFCQHLATLAGGLWIKRLYLHERGGLTLGLLVFEVLWWCFKWVFLGLSIQNGQVIAVPFWLVHGGALYFSPCKKIFFHFNQRPRVQIPNLSKDWQFFTL